MDHNVISLGVRALSLKLKAIKCKCGLEVSLPEDSMKYVCICGVQLALCDDDVIEMRRGKLVIPKGKKRKG